MPDPTTAPAPRPTSLVDQIRCVEREIFLRRQIYVKWVDRGKITQSTADSELACMEAVRDTLRRLAEVAR